MTEDTCSDSSKICCVKEVAPVEPESSMIWIIILIILIIIVIAGIIFRNRIRLFIFKLRGKASASPVIRPGSPPPGSIRPQTMPVGMRKPVAFGTNFGPKVQARPPVKRVLSAKDKEMEETLKKLKEMSR